MCEVVRLVFGAAVCFGVEFVELMCGRRDAAYLSDCCPWLCVEWRVCVCKIQVRGRELLL